MGAAARAMTRSAAFVDRWALRVRALSKPLVSRLGERISPVYRGRIARAQVLIVWFPKTGGTWSRLLLHTALCRHFGITGVEPLDFDSLTDMEPRIPRIRAFHEDEPHWKRPDQLQTSKEKYKNKKVILLARDPRDAIVSHYFQMTKRFRVIDPSMPMGKFVWRESGSLKTWIRYYNIWAENRHVLRDLALVRYEDVHADPAGSLRTMLAFLGVDGVGEEIIAEAVAYNDIGKLRERETAGAHSHRQLRPGIAGDPDSFKARRGKLGGYVDYLTPDEIAAIDAMVKEQLDPWYGYPFRAPTRADISK